MTAGDEARLEETLLSMRESWAPRSGTRTSGDDGGAVTARGACLPPPGCAGWPRATVGVGDLVAGRYRVDALLGVGGMGAVFAATNTITRRRVALKVPHARPGGDDDATRRLEHEARAAGAVRHPNVVDVIDVVPRDDGGHAIVMELCEGESLQRRLDREGRLPVGEACALLRGVVAGLRAAHAAGVVHRDLKPDNVLLAVDTRGQVTAKLVDFGIARLPSNDGPADGFTRGEPVGTPWYMAPEQALDHADVDARADVWALGVLMYQTLSGRLPTRGTTLVQTLLALFTVPIPPLAEVAPGVPEELARVVHAMLVFGRDDRLADLGAVEDVLAAHAAPAPAARGARATRWSPPCEHACLRCTRRSACDPAGERRAG